MNDVDDDAADLVACNECGSDIYSEADRCPYCGSYQTELEVTSTSQPTWVAVTALVVLAVFAFWLLLPLF